jgi:putative addiction module component (TIGR02574 family)
MPVPDIDLAALTIDERLRLIERLWDSIEQSAAAGNREAAKVVSTWSAMDKDFVAELEREADEAEKDPGSTTSWNALLVELKQKYG